MRRRRNPGVLTALRRLGGLGVILVAAVFLVSVAHVHEIAVAAGDEVCAFMGGARTPHAPLADPSDLADRSHDCCDLGLCLGPAVGPSPTVAEVPVPMLFALRLPRPPRPRTPARRRRLGGHRPRAPPPVAPAHSAT